MNANQICNSLLQPLIERTLKTRSTRSMTNIQITINPINLTKIKEPYIYTFDSQFLTTASTLAN